MGAILPHYSKELQHHRKSSESGKKRGQHQRVAWRQPGGGQPGAKRHFQHTVYDDLCDVGQRQFLQNRLKAGTHAGEKDDKGKRAEYISLDLMYKKIINIIIGKKEESSSSVFDNGDIFATFEKEFGRTISSMECQIIKGWIDDNFSHELIMEALKEAVYNGATSLKYIETILYSWRKKGYKTKKEVIDAKAKYHESKKEEKDIFYYDWLNDDWTIDE